MIKSIQTNKMKNTLLLILLLITVSSCTETVPEDLKGKKQYVAKKKAEIREIQKEIDLVNIDIMKLDPPKEKKAVVVKSKVIVPRIFKRYTELEARVVSEDAANVSSDIGGRLVQLNVKEGDYVKRGQLIGVTDVELFETQMEELNTSLALANTVFEKQSRLWQQNIGSEIQYLQAKNNVEQLQKSVESLKTRLKKKNLYAPISGAVDMKFIGEGEMTGPGTPIVRILNTSKVKVVADVQESLLGSVKKGDKVEVFYPALDKTVTHKITQIGRTIDPTNRTFKVEIKADNSKRDLKPNLLSIVKVNDFTAENSLFIPLDIIREEVTGDKYVYKVIEKDGKKIAKKVKITLGESSGNKVIVESGIESNDEIIITGGSSLADNSLILPSLQTEEDE